VGVVVRMAETMGHRVLTTTIVSVKAERWHLWEDEELHKQL
jgi:hypothetical protein